MCPELGLSSRVPPAERQQLIARTRRAVGDIAAQGIRGLHKMPPDSGYPIFLRSGIGMPPLLPFQRYDGMRRVTPAPSADQTIPGYNLALAMAATGYAYRLQPVYDLARRLHIPYPSGARRPDFSARRSQELMIGLSADPHMPKEENHLNSDFTIYLTRTGRASKGVDATSRFASVREYRDLAEHAALARTEVIDKDDGPHTETLVLAAMGAQALHNYGITIDIEPAATVFNDWRTAHNLSPIGDDMWLHTTDVLLRQQLQDAPDV